MITSKYTLKLKHIIQNIVANSKKLNNKGNRACLSRNLTSKTVIQKIKNKGFVHDVQCPYQARCHPKRPFHRIQPLVLNYYKIYTVYKRPPMDLGCNTHFRASLEVISPEFPLSKNNTLSQFSCLQAWFSHPLAAQGVSHVFKEVIRI